TFGSNRWGAFAGGNLPRCRADCECQLMIIGKSQREIEKMRAAGQLVGQVLLELRNMVEAGMTTLEVNDAADQMIRDAGAYPTFKGYNGFPFQFARRSTNKWYTASLRSMSYRKATSSRLTWESP